MCCFLTLLGSVENCLAMRRQVASCEDMMIVYV